MFSQRNSTATGHRRRSGRRGGLALREVVAYDMIAGVDLRRIVKTGGLRQARYDRLARLVKLRPTDRIVDIGCGPGVRTIAAYNQTNSIVGVDLLPPEEVQLSQLNVRYVQGDATNLSGIGNDEFDVAFSIGLLEHIRPQDQLVAAIREMQRVAPRYIALVPHRHSFIEPHFQMPLYSDWPNGLKSFAIKHFRLGSQSRRPDGAWQRINWLSGKDWLKLFDDPTARAYRHWYGPFLQYTIIVGGRGLSDARR
jgi:SAM-dependent methyltransferase